MAKRILKPISVFLIFALLLAVPLSVAGADSSGVCFTATNDKLQLLSLRTVYVGGMAYVPYTIFSYFGVSANYFSSENVAMLNVGSNQVIFYLNDGTCVDGNGTSYPISATSLNGTVYVPANTGTFFGLSNTLIAGNGNGDVLRIKNGSQSLSDSEFLDAASSLMESRYAEYFGTPATTPIPEITPTPEPSESQEIDGGDVYLNFIGLPSSKLLDILRNNSVDACFFLTADDAAVDPDLVRRLIGEGNTVGVYCSAEPGNSCEKAAEAIQEAAFCRPTIMTTSQPENESHTAYAKSNGFAFYTPSKIITADVKDASAITLSLPKTHSVSDFCFYIGENTEAMLPMILQYLKSNGYEALPLLETSL